MLFGARVPSLPNPLGLLSWGLSLRVPFGTPLAGVGMGEGISIAWWDASTQERGERGIALPLASNPSWWGETKPVPPPTSLEISEVGNAVLVLPTHLCLAFGGSSTPGSARSGMAVTPSPSPPAFI